MTATVPGLVASAQQVTRKHLDAFLPAYLKRLKRLQRTPPKSLDRLYHRYLDKCDGHPGRILRQYIRYSHSKSESGSVSLRVRYLTALAHCYGFNSFWATEDKQKLCGFRSFKYLIFDIASEKERLNSLHVPRLIYAMTALEYRSCHLLPRTLDILKGSLERYRPPTLATIGLCLAYLGIGDSAESNQFGFSNNLSANYSGLLERICRHVAQCIQTETYRSNQKALLGPFEASGLSFAMVMANLYDLSLEGVSSPEKPSTPILPLFLKEACRELTAVNLPHSGWVQFYLYLTLYCTDVEKPKNEIAIKKSIPFHFQKSLHMRWLDKILLNGQPQGSEYLQASVDDIFRRLQMTDSALINCSGGRPWDEQHCWFAGHLLKERGLSLHYDSLAPLGSLRPKASGWIQLQSRMFRQFGFNAVVVHKHLWDPLSLHQREVQLTKILSYGKAPGTSTEDRSQESEQSAQKSSAGEESLLVPRPPAPYGRGRHSGSRAVSPYCYADALDPYLNRKRRTYRAMREKRFEGVKIVL